MKEHRKCRTRDCPVMTNHASGYCPECRLYAPKLKKRNRKERKP